MKQESSVEERARKVLDELGYSMFAIRIIERPTQHGIEASINCNDFNTEIVHDPKWQEIFNQSRKDYLKRNPRFRELLGDSEEVLDAVVKHEHGHWRYCPYDIEHLEGILNGIARGLREADVKITPELIHSKANEFEDVIDNSSLALDDPKTRKGRASKYLNEAYTNNQKKPEFPSNFGIFADVQMRLYYPEASQLVKSLMPKYDKEAKPLVDQLLMEFGKPLQLGPGLIESNVPEEKRAQLLKLLKDPRFWPELAYQWAKLTAHLDPVPLEQTPFHLKLKNDPEYRKQLIQAALQKGHDPSPYSDPFEVFQQKFLAQGRRIKHDILDKDEAEKDIGLPYAHLRHNPTKIPKDIRLSKTRPDENGTLIFKRRGSPLILPPRAQEGQSSLADLLFVCDNSGSMQGQKYEILVSTASAIFEDLRSIEKLHLLRYGLIQFSDADCSSWSGWHTSPEPLEREFYNTISSRRFGKETKLQPAFLRAAQRENAALIGISDGEIHNEQEALKAVLEYKGPVAWFQIGSGTSFSESLKNQGKIVHVVSNIEELPESLLKTTHLLYT